jgi:hypothetical protein
MTDARLPRSDDELQELLAGALRGLDLTSDVGPVPSHVTEGSLWVHDFVTADAELAAIIADSANGAPVGVRGLASVRAISFASQDFEIDVEISDVAWDTRRIAGMVVPGGEGTARLAVGGRRSETEIDERGRFVFAEVPMGTALITLQFGDVTLRLDPFLL